MRGIDEWKDVEAVIVLGNWLHAIDVVQDQAAVLAMLSGRSMTPTGQYERELRGIRMTDGTGVGVQVWTHPDPLAAAVMEQAREAETEQALARVRPVRHVGEPKRVLLMSSLPVDVTVDELVELKVLAGEDRLGRLLKAGGGVAILSPRWMVQSGVFETEKAAERWLERELYPPNSYRYLLEERGVKPGAFRRRGQRGPKPTRFLATPDCPDPRAVLEAREGELTFYEGPKPAPAIHLKLALNATGGSVPVPLEFRRPLGGNSEVRLQ